ncbi:MAG: hypothetical protein RI894_868, partial [Bacteroidota bacterium]
MALLILRFAAGAYPIFTPILPPMYFSYAEFYHITLGMLLMMFGYIVVNWIQIRKTIYGYYAFYIGLQWLYFYLIQDNILSGQAMTSTWLILTTRCFAWALYNIFAISFLELPLRDKSLCRYPQWNIALSAIAFVSMSICYYIGRDDLARAITDNVKILIYLLGLIVVFKVLKWRIPISNYFVLGSLALILCEMTNIILAKTCHTNLGISELRHLSPDNPFAHFGFFSIIGVVLDLSFLTLGLVYLHRESTLENLRAEYEKKRALEDERNRIARDMHDDLGSGLSALQMMSQVAAHTHTPGSMQTSVERIASLSQELNQRVREIVWTTSSEADTLPSLIYFLRRFVADLTDAQHLDFQSNIPDDLPDLPITGAVRRNVLLCVKEILNNSMKYAHPTKIAMSVNIHNELLTIHLSDDGQGFDIDLALQRGGNGLRNIQQRMAE